MSKGYTSKVGWPDYLVDALIEPITEGYAVETSGKQDFVEPLRETLPTRKARQVAGDVGAHSSIMWPPMPVELVRIQRENLCREWFGGRCAEAQHAETIWQHARRETSGETTSEGESQQGPWQLHTGQILIESLSKC